jgi:hypothetical protein
MAAAIAFGATTSGTTGAGTGSVTFSSIAIGTAALDRIVAVGLTFQSDLTVASVTIGGIAATVRRVQSDTGGSPDLRAEIWAARVPTGTTANIDVTLSSAGAVVVGITTVAITGAGSVPTDTDANSGSAATLAVTGVTINTNGVAFYCFANDTQGTAVAWTNGSEVSDASYNPHRHSCATRNTAGTVTTTADGATAAQAMVGVAWGPGLYLAADGGSYSFTGTAAALRTKTSAGAGSYAFTGTAAALRTKTPAGAGSYAFTGTAATAVHAWRLAVDSGQPILDENDLPILDENDLPILDGPPAGAYTFTGTSANGSIGKKLVAGAGSYAFTGTDATPKHAWKLAADAGVYAFTGSAVSLRLKTSAVAGAYAFTGTAATPVHAWKLSADAGAYAFTGQSVSLRLKTSAVAGSYAFTGTDATARHNWKLSAEAGAYSFAGTDATPRHAWNVSAEAGEYSFTGTDATPTITAAGAFALIADAGSYAFSGTDATPRHAWRVSADVGEYAFTGTDATIHHAWRLAADAGAYSFSGTDASVLHGWKLAAEDGAYVFTGTAANPTASGQAEEDSSNVWDRTHRRSRRTASFEIAEQGEDRAQLRALVRWTHPQATIRAVEQGQDTASLSAIVVPRSVARIDAAEQGVDCACISAEVFWPPPIPGDFASILFDMDRELASSRVQETGRDTASLRATVAWRADGNLVADLLADFDAPIPAPVRKVAPPKPAPVAKPEPTVDADRLAALMPMIDWDMHSNTVRERGNDTARLKASVSWRVSAEALTGLMEMMDA